MPRDSKATMIKIATYLTRWEGEKSLKGGKTVAQIATATGLSESTVAKHLTTMAHDKTARKIRLDHDQRKFIWFRA